MSSSTESGAAYDALVVGSGAGGSAAAYRLAIAGWHIAIVEKGRKLPRDRSTLDVDKVVLQGVFKSKERWRDSEGNEFAPEEYFNVGGKTKWYGAALLRFSGREIEADPEHGCPAWPLNLDDLRPYDEQAERRLGARTFSAEPDLERILRRLAAAAPDWTGLPLPMGLSAAMDEVIDWLTFYNHRRLHSTLGYVSPMRFEEHWHAGQSKQAA